jgi:hypothetical protein
MLESSIKFKLAVEPWSQLPVGWCDPVDESTLHPLCVISSRSVGTFLDLYNIRMSQCVIYYFELFLPNLQLTGLLQALRRLACLLDQHSLSSA